MNSIIKKTFITAIVLAFTLTPLTAEEINILFVGNSFTFRHDLKNLVKEAFEEGHPELTVNVESSIYGGQDLFRHHDLYFSDSLVRLNSISIDEVERKLAKIKTIDALEEAPEFYQAYWKETGLRPVDWMNKNLQKSLKTAQIRQNRVINLIKRNQRKKWDYVVLQSWLDIVEEVDKGYGKYAQLFAKIAEEEGAKVILYITAPYAQNAESVKGPLKSKKATSEMQTITRLAGRIKPYAVVPVPLAINKIQQNGTDITFRYSNDFHPNQTTAFLTANMFYAAFFKESPQGLNFNQVTENKLDDDGLDPDGGSATVTFDEKTKAILQKAAYDAVMEFDSSL